MYESAAAISSVLGHQANTSVLGGGAGSAEDEFADPPTIKVVAFLGLFTLSFLFTIVLFVINLYKSLKIATEQKSLLKKAGTVLRRDTAKPDLMIEVGLPLPRNPRRKSKLE